jgi:O-antigen/teichoic acid export membrane protein
MDAFPINRDLRFEASEVRARASSPTAAAFDGKGAMEGLKMAAKPTSDEEGGRFPGLVAFGLDACRSAWRIAARPGQARRVLAGMFAANVAIQILNLGTGVLTARALGPDGRGELAAILLWPQFLVYCLALGLPASLVYHLKKRPWDASQLVGASLASSLALGAVASLVGVFALPVWLANYPHRVVLVAQLAMAVAPLTSLSLTLLTILQGFESFAAFNWLRLAQPALTLAGLSAIAALHALTALSGAAIYLLAPLPVTAWNARYVLRQAPPSFERLLTHLRALYSYGLRYSVADFAGTLAGQADRVVIAGFLRPAELGLYVVAQSLAQLLGMISATATTVLFPKAAGLERASALRLSMRSAAQSGLAALVAAAPLIVLGPWLLGVVYGPEFANVGGFLATLVAASAVAVVCLVLQQGLLAIGRPGVASLTQTFGVAASVALLWLLTPRYGLEGAALAMLAAALVRFAFLAIAVIGFARRVPD